MERWQKQTKFFNPDLGGGGNCTEAALASVFNIPLEQMPTFHPGRDERNDPSAAKEFWDNFEDWLLGKGYIAIMKDGNYCPECVYLASGPSSRGCSHMVVYQDGQMIHDPHPSGEGILEVEQVWLLVPVDPAFIPKAA